MKQISVSEIAKHVGGHLVGDADVLVSGVADLRAAKAGEISFLYNASFEDALSCTQASAVLLKQSMLANCKVTAIVVDNPYLAYAKVAQLLDTTPRPADGMALGISVHPSATLGRNVTLAHGVVIGADAQIDDNVSIGANTVIGQGATIGANTRLWSNISIYHQVKIGSDCLVHSGTVIGADGFGYAQDRASWVKIPQLGVVVIGNRVEIGANCTIDRGALSDTIIADGVIIDNLVHIAHNVRLGENVAIAGCSAVAGSTVIEKGVTLSGRSNVLGHLHISEGVHITACTLVTQSLSTPGVYSSGTVQQENKEWRKSVARFQQLDSMARRIRALEKALALSQQEKNL